MLGIGIGLRDVRPACAEVLRGWLLKAMNDMKEAAKRTIRRRLGRAGLYAAPRATKGIEAES